LTEVLFPEALERAKFLDSHLEKTGEVIGPLHGLPISLKDCMITPPYPSSIGMAHYANGPTRPEEETLLVTILAKLGAVFFVKTNTPTAMMMMETINNVWGETNSPYHSGSSAGGSTGGEGALLAMRGSPLGIGTDIGGSIRIPSAFNNLFGLKPTSVFQSLARLSTDLTLRFGRFPVYGTRSGIMGQDYICSINGPMSRSLEALKVYCRAVLSTDVSPWTLDPKTLPIPWREDVMQPKGRKLRFGIISDNDGQVSTHPPIARGLKMAKAALEAAGHEVFEWTPTDHPEIAEVVNSSFHTLGGAAILELTRLYDEPVYGSMKAYEESYNRGEDGTLGPTKLRQMIIRRNALQKAYLDRWNATAGDGKPVMDGIIAAVSPWTAPRLGITQTLFNVNYTIVYNLLGEDKISWIHIIADTVKTIHLARSQ
jgi:amidase